MKWLTREWATGALNDEEWNGRERAYLEHCAEIRPTLSGGAEMLLREINLHDAQIHSFEYRPREVLAIRALIGDLQVGYQFIELTFANAELRLEAGRTVEALRLDDARTEIIYDEVDIEADGRFVHRVLLSPEGEYEVLFTALKEQRGSANPSDRRWQSLGARP